MDITEDELRAALRLAFCAALEASSQSATGAAVDLVPGLGAAELRAVAADALGRCGHALAIARLAGGLPRSYPKPHLLGASFDYVLQDLSACAIRSAMALGVLTPPDSGHFRAIRE